MVKISGIKNCDTMKKALRWLDAQHIPYEFIDYKKSVVSDTWIANMLAQHGLDTIVNKRGTTFRKLDEQTKAELNEENAVALLCEHTSMIKRPILEKDGASVVGFSAEKYEAFFNE